MARRQTLLVAVATVLALVSAWHDARPVWRHITRVRSAYAGYSPLERRRAPIAALGLSPDIFDFFARYVGPGDRVFYQVQPSGYSTFLDLPEAVEAAGRFYLLPAVQVTDLSQATVVVSWLADPGQLHVHFVTQTRDGLQLFFVSRIRTP